MCTIRIADKKDIDQIVNLMEAFYAESDYPFVPDKASSAFEALFSNESFGQCWLIECNSAPIGYIAVTYTFSLEYFGYAAFIEDLYISSDYRNKGLGRRALEAAETECRKRGILALHLEVGTGNVNGKRLYERFGFTTTDRKLLNKPLTET
jgi:ribosomal protein S18 acetylase RimI-like enzyme